MSLDIAHLAEIPAARAAADAMAVAVTMGSETLTYRSLAERTGNVAAALVDAGVRPGDRIAFLDKNSMRFFEVFFGALNAGAVVVGVNYRLAAPEVEYIVNDAGARVIFVGKDFFALLESIEARLPDGITIVAIDGGHARWPGIDQWQRERRAVLMPRPDVEADVLQLYTSGTTGLPKGAVASNRAFLAFARSATLDWAKMTPADTQLVCMPLCHVAGLNSSLVGFLQGARTILTREVDPAQILSLIESEGITQTLLAPAIIQALLAAADPARDYTSLKQLNYGAAPIAQSVLDQASALFQCDFVHLYGLTECLGAATFLPPEAHDPALGKLRSCGRAYRGAAVRVVADDGTEASTGIVGEIEVSAPWLMSGYWNKPEATAETIRDGWLRTGDAGYLDEDGYLYIHDRVKDMIVTGGENVYPAEVENALFGHPAVADVAVIGVPDERWGESVKAIVVLKPDSPVSAADLIAFARDKIAGYKLPKSVDFVDALPRNASGKVLRRELREPYWEGVGRRVH